MNQQLELFSMEGQLFTYCGHAWIVFWFVRYDGQFLNHHYIIKVK